MKFEEILPHLRAGREAKNIDGDRIRWHDGKFQRFENAGWTHYRLDAYEIDGAWKLVPEVPQTAGEALWSATRGYNDAEWCDFRDDVKQMHEARAQAVIAWHESQKTTSGVEGNDALERLAQSIQDARKSSAPDVSAEPKSLAAIAQNGYELCRDRLCSGDPLSYIGPEARRICWDASAQAVRAEVLTTVYQRLPESEVQTIAARYGLSATNVEDVVWDADECRRADGLRSK